MGGPPFDMLECMTNNKQRCSAIKREHTSSTFPVGENLDVRGKFRDFCQLNSSISRRNKTCSDQLFVCFCLEFQLLAKTCAHF